MRSHRREFLAEVGRGMLLASVGTAVASDLGLATVWAEPSKERLTFGPREPLVNLLQQTPVEKLLPVLVEKLNSGVALRDLVAAGALANARAFGGQNYVGYHTLMALLPAYEMSRQLPKEQQALPVFKVLYRNSDNIQKNGVHDSDVLHHVEAIAPSSRDRGTALREAVRAVDMQGAEQTFAGIAQSGPQQAFDELQPIVHDQTNVHRVVLALRGWALLDLTGAEHAHTLLRQSVRYCVEEEQGVAKLKEPPAIRSLLPKLMDQYRLASRSLGTRQPDDAWINQMCETITTGGREYAADAVAAALAEGILPDAIGEAMSLAANQLVLRDPGRPDDRQAEKPRGSVHGDSVGVHDA